MAMSELIMGQWTSQAIVAAAQLHLADALADGPLPLEELARRVDANPEALARLLRALIGRAIFRQLRDGRYALTPLADTLRSDAPMSVAAVARFVGSREHRELWSLLADAVRTGHSVVPALHGTDAFSYLAENPDSAAVFNDAMTAMSNLATASILHAYDFKPFPIVIDVGGGHGRLLSAILAATPSARGVLYDLPNVVAGATAVLAEAGMTTRACVESGSFFTSVPTGGDAYILKNVIHDWGDEPAEAILRNVAAAAHPQAKLLLVELVIPERDREFAGKWTDLEMLIMSDGRERTAAQYRDLLERSGFRLTRIVQTASPLSIIEAVPTQSIPNA